MATALPWALTKAAAAVDFSHLLWLDGLLKLSSSAPSDIMHLCASLFLCLSEVKRHT